MCKMFFELDYDIYIAVVYNSPEFSSFSGREKPEFFENIELDIAHYSKIGKVIFTGDVNARTGTEYDFFTDNEVDFIPCPTLDIQSTNVRHRSNQDKICKGYGNALLDLCKTTDLRILNGRTIGDSLGKLTCYHYNGSSTVDYAIVHMSLLPKVAFFKVHNWMSTISDHCCISFSISVKTKEVVHVCEEQSELTQVNMRYHWDAESPDKFRSSLALPSIQAKLKTITDNVLDLDHNTLVDNFCEVLHNAADNSLRPKARGKKKHSRPKRQKWFDLDCVQLKKECSLLGRQLQKDPSNNYLRNLCFQLKKKYRITIRKKKREFKLNVLSNLEKMHSTNPKEYWKMVSDLQNSNKSTSQEPISSKAWYTYFSKLLSTKPTPNPPFEDEILSKIQNMENNSTFSEFDYEITTTEIENVLKKLKSGKAVGIDGISNEMLKCGRSIFLKPLCTLFNKIFASGEYPLQWSEGIITTLFKNGDRMNPDNYRGITLCSSLAKVYSTIINSRITNFIDKYKLRAEEQIGFTAKARTSDHMFVLKTIIDMCHKEKTPLYACFVDYRKAFDTVWWQGLFYKLLKTGISSGLYKTVTSMYTAVNSRISTRLGLTAPFSIYQGVRQGEVLSPTLFNIFVNDLPEFLSSAISDPICMNNKKVNCLMYADDIVILTKNKSDLQCSLDKLHDYCQKWKLTVNLTKTKIIIFNVRGRFMKNVFTYGHQTVECVNQYKYLGIHFNNCGTFGPAINDLKIKARRAVFHLIKSINIYELGPKVALSLFDSLIKPILMYGSEVWGPCIFNASSETKLMTQLTKFPHETIMLSFARATMRVHKHTHNYAVRGELGIYPLGVDILARALKYKDHIYSNKNSLVWHATQHINRHPHISKWWLSVENHLHLFKLSETPSDKDLKMALQKLFIQNWKATIADQNSKLRFYAKIKDKFNFEPYLNSIKNPLHRSALAKLRTSSHKLMIETGRYTSPKTPELKRLCINCNVVEDESHFLLECQNFNTERGHFINNISSLCPNFANLNKFEKCYYLLNSEDVIANETGKFIFSSFEKRDGIMNSK